MEREITTELNLETPYGWVDWTVTIIYEYDGGIQINGVYDDLENPENDLWASLTKEQQGHVEMACIDDYADLCDYEAARAEDMAAARAEAAMEARQEYLAERDSQRGYRI